MASKVHVLSSSEDSGSDCEVLPLYARITQKVTEKAPLKDSEICCIPSAEAKVVVAQSTAADHARWPASEGRRRSSDKTKAVYTELYNYKELPAPSSKQLPPTFNSKIKMIDGMPDSQSNYWGGDDLPDLDVMTEFDRTWDMEDLDMLTSRRSEKMSKPHRRAEFINIKDAAGAPTKKRCQKKEEKERDQLLKKMRQENLRNSRPAECVKRFKVCLDTAVLELPEAASVMTLLRESEINCFSIEHVVPCSVSWIREVPRVFLDHRQMIDTAVDQIEEKEVLIVVPTKRFVSAVHSFKQKQIGNTAEQSLKEMATELEQALPNKRLTLMACGLDHYFRTGRRKNQSDYRANVLGEQAHGGRNSGKRRKDDGRYFNLVSRVDVEEALVDLQINHPHCNVRLVDNSLDMAEIITAFTRGLAKASSENSEEDGGQNRVALFAQNDNRQPVKVDKNGNGLLLLWQRQIEQFHMVAADVAQAIISKYPSPRALLMAYKRCASERECHVMLKDIVVRRGVGPLANSRKLGPELSRKMYQLLTATDGNVVLETK